MTTPIREIWPLRGGLELTHNKQQSTQSPIQSAKPSKILRIPLQQHIGGMAIPCVKIGDKVLKGQLIAKAKGTISANIHASSSGHISAIEAHPIIHPSGLSSLCIEIKTDGFDEWITLAEPITYCGIDNTQVLIERIQQSGIVGMGGAAFPSSSKLFQGENLDINTLIINGVECEPYISCDDMLMREQADQIIKGIKVMQCMLQAEQCLIGIEDNKPEAIAAMQLAIDQFPSENIDIVTIPTLYPSGGEKQLIQILTGMEVPSGQVPSALGIVCQNVGTAKAIADAVFEGKPLISRIITLTGEGIKQPQNLEVPIGTLLSELIPQAGGLTDKLTHTLSGGPMMGIDLSTHEIPTTKSSNCFLFPSTQEAADPGTAFACIRCGHCADVCPVNLLPQQLYWYAKAENIEKTLDYNLFDCIECGCCSHVCPSHIPLVQYYRHAKSAYREQQENQKKADRARQRHENRDARLDKLAAEKKEMLRQKREEMLKKKALAEKNKDPKLDAIAAAVARANAKKQRLQKEGLAPKNQQQLTASQQAQIDQANHRRQEKDS